MISSDCGYGEVLLNMSYMSTKRIQEKKHNHLIDSDISPFYNDRDELLRVNLFEISSDRSRVHLTNN